MKYLMMMLVLCWMCFGAMTRNDICVEQNKFFQASTLNNGTRSFRGCTVWMPMDYDNDIYQGWVLKEHLVEDIIEGGPTDGVACWQIHNHLKAKFYAGTYIPAIYDHATYTRPGELAYTGAFTDYTSQTIAGGYSGWHGVYRVNATFKVTLTVPTSTTRLYMYVQPVNSAGLTCEVVKVSGTATLVKSSFSVHTTGDFGSDHTGLLNNNYALIATNCGDAEISFTHGGQTGAGMYLMGWVAINDNLSAQPDTGVFDPTTVVYLNAANTQNGAEGPLWLEFATGTTTPFIWGLGHWTADQTVTGESETDVLTTLISASNAITFTDNTWVREIGNKFTRTLTGNIQVKNGAAAAVSAGTYSSVYEFTPSQLKIENTHTFNADAATAGLKLNESNGGGYAGKWNIPRSCTYGKFYGDKKWTRIGYNYSDSYPITGNGTGIIMYSPELDLCYDFMCDSICYNAAATSGYSDIYVLLSSSGTFPKIYKRVCATAADVVLADGDIVKGTQYRRNYPFYVSNDPMPRRLTSGKKYIMETE